MPRSVPVGRACRSARRKCVATRLGRRHWRAKAISASWSGCGLVPRWKCMATAAKVFAQVWGKETVFVRSGGSIPVVALFYEHLGIPSIMMGFGLPDDNLHAPNEKFNLDNFYKGSETIARFLAALGG